MTGHQLENMLCRVQKPGRYSGGEMGQTVKDKNEVEVRFAFCFPDTYEIGMSHLGIKILYSALNALDYVWCERVFAPWEDMEQQLRENKLPLYALESRDAICDFDFVGFTLQYEMSYTNILNMLDLGGIPLKASDRGNDDPLVIAGGPCVCNPEPVCDFIDIISLGEGEEALPELMELYRKHKKAGYDKQKFLKEVAQLDGFYVPSFYDVTYKDDNTIEAITPTNGAPATITKRIMKNMDEAHYPEQFIVPYVEVVHDRAVQEIFRGCIRGCRFCQAGFIYRPVREKTAETANRQAKSLCDLGGYDEVSISSLSTSDYTHLEELLNSMLKWTEKDGVGLSLPSLRVDNFSDELMKKVQGVRKSGLTFAPEAGTQRLRDVINKNVTEEEVLRTANIAFSGGNTNIKLYFMMGLPTETLDDIKGIADLAQAVVDAFYARPDKPKGKGVTVSISVAGFIPKPHTPFQWEPQNTAAQLEEKQRHLISCIHTKKINVSCHESPTSYMEGVLARGDRRLGRVIEEAFRSGCKMDSWHECFSLEKWLAAFEKCGVDPNFYNTRKREYGEVLPWSHLDFGIDEKFLQSENEKAKRAETTLNCREKCAGCGAAKLCHESCKIKKIIRKNECGNQ